MNNARALLGGAAARLGAVRTLRAAVAGFFTAHPRTASAFTGFATFSLGDIIAQRLEMEQSGGSAAVESKHGSGGDSSGSKHRLTIDFIRSLQVGLLGLFMNGVCLHTWFNTLDKMIGTSMTSTSTVVMKMLADQIIYAPFAIVAFFGFAAMRHSTHWGDIYEAFKLRMRSSFWQTYFADCKLWPVANFINFRWVPLVYRASFSAMVQLIWQTYMSAVTEGTDKEAVNLVVDDTIVSVASFVNSDIPEVATEVVNVAVSAATAASNEFTTAAAAGIAADTATSVTVLTSIDGLRTDSVPTTADDDDDDDGGKRNAMEK